MASLLLDDQTLHLLSVKSTHKKLRLIWDATSTLSAAISGAYMKTDQEIR